MDLKKYKNVIILGVIGIGVYLFFFVKIADNGTRTLFEVIRNMSADNNIT